MYLSGEWPRDYVFLPTGPTMRIGFLFEPESMHAGLFGPSGIHRTGLRGRSTFGGCWVGKHFHN